MQNQLDVNLHIFQLAEKFRAPVTFVFENLGKDDEDTTFETFNDIGRFKTDSTNIGFFSSKNPMYRFFGFSASRSIADRKFPSGIGTAYRKYRL